jgi:hypothetical protein
VAIRDLRSLFVLAHSLAHDISEDALELEKRLAHLRFYAAQVGDAGISTLAHVASASALVPPVDLHARVELRTALYGALEALDRLSLLVRRLHERDQVDPAVIDRLRRHSEELTAVIRALIAECNRSYGLRTA